MEPKAVVNLRKGEGRTIKAGGLWIFDNEIESVMGSVEDGDIVIVRDFDGYPMGRGFINRKSKITVRMLTRDAEQDINEAFLRMRVKNAWEYRKAVMQGDDLTCCRVIFGEADFLPGLVVDRFSDVLVVESLALGIDLYKEQIVDLLKEIMAQDGVKIRGVYERRCVRRKDLLHIKDASVRSLIRLSRSWRTACIIRSMWQMDRRQDSSLTRNTTGLRCRD